MRMKPRHWFLLLLLIVACDRPRPDGSLAASTVSGPAAALQIPARAQATDLTVTHRGGQSFIAWKEVGVPEIGGEPSVVNVLRVKTELAKRIKYRIYLASSPISSLTSLKPIAEVLPLTGWNTEIAGID